MSHLCNLAIKDGEQLTPEDRQIIQDSIPVNGRPDEEKSKEDKKKSQEIERILENSSLSKLQASFVAINGLRSRFFQPHDSRRTVNRQVEAVIGQPYRDEDQPKAVIKKPNKTPEEPAQLETRSRQELEVGVWYSIGW